MSGRAWTDDEIGFLEDNWDLTAREAGEAIGRSMGAVHRKRGQMRGGEVTMANPWTDDEDDFIRATSNLTARQVSEKLGRSWHAVRSRRDHLGVRAETTNRSPFRVGKRPLIAKTCPKCGLLLDATWFRLTASRVWFGTCTRCRPRTGTSRPGRDRRTPAEAAARAAKLQAITLPHAINKGNPWTEADHAVACDPDLTLVEKALRLGRTYFATHNFTSTNGYPSKIGRGDATKGQWLIDNPNAPTIKESAA